MKLGNIISDGELVNHDILNYINYYDFSSKENIDYSLPTLFVGWITLKNTFTGNEFDILEKTIKKNNKFWEFSFNENKAQHVSGIANFIDYVPKYYFESKYSYEIIDPVFSNIKVIDGLLNIIKINIYQSTYNYKNEFLYLLTDNKIYGIDLKMFDFFKITKSEILSYIENNCDKYINDIDGEIKMNYYKILPNYSNLRRYLVVL